MTTSKTYQTPGVKVTVELEDGFTIKETCPGDNDLIVFVQDRFTLHLKRNILEVLAVQVDKIVEGGEFRSRADYVNNLIREDLKNRNAVKTPKS